MPHIAQHELLMGSGAKSAAPCRWELEVERCERLVTTTVNPTTIVDQTAPDAACSAGMTAIVDPQALLPRTVAVLQPVPLDGLKCGQVIDRLPLPQLGDGAAIYFSTPAVLMGLPGVTPPEACGADGPFIEHDGVESCFDGGAGTLQPGGGLALFFPTLFDNLLDQPDITVSLPPGVQAFGMLGLAANQFGVWQYVVQGRDGAGNVVQKERPAASASDPTICVPAFFGFDTFGSSADRAANGLREVTVRLPQAPTPLRYNVGTFMFGLFYAPLPAGGAPVPCPPLATTSFAEAELYNGARFQQQARGKYSKTFKLSDFAVPLE